MKTLLFPIFLLHIINFCSSSSLLGDNFGLYNMCVNELNSCKGYLKTDLGIVRAHLDDTKQAINANITFDTDIMNPMFELRISIWDGYVFKPLTIFHAHSGCKDTALRRYLYDQVVKFKSINGKCIISKGSYVNPSINISATAHSIVPKFFYGKTKARLYVTSKRSNVLCMELICETRRETCT